MTTLLEQVEALDFEAREKIVIALKKRPEKTKEELMLEEIKSLRTDLAKSEKKINSKIENITMLFIAFICVILFLFPSSSSSKIPLRLF
jgi:hypothetical protein